MRILIIDNGTSYLNRLKDLVDDRNEVITYSEINQDNVKNFDAVVLSGGHAFPVVGNEDRLKKEIELVRNFQKPVFGICFGFELIVFAFGGELELMEKKECGILDIQVIEPDEIFSNIPSFSVFENHRWVVREPGEELIVLAKSKDGIEAVKHKTRSIYGVQFHPEMFVDKTCGDEIFHNFLNSIK